MSYRHWRQSRAGIRVDIVFAIDRRVCLKLLLGLYCLAELFELHRALIPHLLELSCSPCYV